MNQEVPLGLVVQTLRTANTLLRESRRLFRPHGLTEAQFNVLNVLGPAPGPISQRELSEILVVDRSNVTGLVDRMERAGWVKRGDVPGDRRAYRLSLTPRGRRLWEKALADYEKAVRAAVGPIGEPRARSAIETLRQIETAAADIVGRLNRK